MVKNTIVSSVLKSVSTFKKQDGKFVGVRSFFIVFILYNKSMQNICPKSISCEINVKFIIIPDSNITMLLKH